MSIVQGQNGNASDFVSSSSGAADSGKVAKLDSTGKIPPAFIPAAKFGGTGADGALSISSGTTTLNLGAAKVFIKNYTTISITGTAKLAFSNPNASGTVIILKSQGDITLTSSQTPMIDISNCGGAGSSGAVSTSTTPANSSAATGASFGFFSTSGGGPSSGSTAGAVTFGAPATFSDLLAEKWSILVLGSGGSGGGAQGNSGQTATGGNGGAGAGALILQCGGTFTFTTTGGLSTNGVPGTNASITGGVATSSAGGGSGGGCGSVFVLYNTAGTITGTITNTGALGGSGADQGGSVSVRSGNSGAGYTNGTAGTSGHGPSGTTGGTGLAVMQLNTEYA